MTELMTTPLAQADRVDLHGGKAANLARLIRGGFAVPDGFCLSVDWCRRHLESVPGGEPSRIASTPMPGPMRRRLLAAYHRLGGGPVAVRSSATTEDSAEASFAGQQDTFLDVTGDDELVRAVQGCWASLWNDRAVDYRRRQGDEDAPALAVVVQMMVPVSSAGVTFTANPLTGRRGELVIDAADTPGEDIVSGRVDPDHLVVPPAGPLPGGDFCLSADETRALVEVCRLIEREFGAPQDIEWALDQERRLWITQTRPITTLYPVPSSRSAEAAQDGQERIYFCASHSWQGIRGPLTAAGISALSVAAASVAGLGRARHVLDLAGAPFSTGAGNRWFLDVTAAATSTPGRVILQRMMGLVDARSAGAVGALGWPVRTRTPRRAVAAWLGRAAAGHHVPRRLVAALRNPQRAREASAAIRDEIDADRARLTPSPLVAGQFIDRWAGAVWARVLPLTGLGMAMAALGARLAGPGADEEDLSRVLRGIPGNPTTEMDIALEHLLDDLPGGWDWIRSQDAEHLEEMRRRGSLPPQLSGRLNDFLARHGHRAVAEIDLGVPRWSEDARPVLASLVAMSRSPLRGHHASDQYAQAEAQAGEVLDRLAAGSRHPSLLRFCYGRARGLLGHRELAKYLNVRVLAGARSLLLDHGAELARRGVLDEPTDIFWLSLAEAQAAAQVPDLRSLVRRRAAEFDRERRRGHVPHVILSDGTEPAEPDAGGTADGAAAGTMRGTAASAGSVAGRVRVITDPAGATLEPGEVLVAPTIDPAWTPLFWAAAAVVVETGGVNSHGAVVAREFGIPAVVGVPRVTSQLRTGEQVEVNGALGRIRVLENAPGG